MAQDSIMNSLFGISPETFRQSRDEETRKQAIEFAKLDPYQRADEMAFIAGRGLGNIVGGALGAEDPQLLRITAQDQILKSLDLSDPQSINTGIVRAQQAGIPELAYRLLGARDEAITRSQTQRGLQLSQEAQQLLPQIKNPDGTINEEVKNKLMSSQQGRAAISELAKVIPDLRRIGVAGTPETNPFELFVNDPNIPAPLKLTAQQYASSFAKGIYSEEQADKLVASLSTATQRATEFKQTQDRLKQNDEQMRIFKEQGLANSQAYLNLAQQQASLLADSKRQEAERKAEIAKNKPLPANLSKAEEEDFDTATATTNLATDAYQFVNRIKSGEIKFGLKDRASIATRSALGSNDPDVIARRDYDKFVQRLTTENLRLNKGVQTDKDFERELNLLKSAESTADAAQIMNNLVNINIRKTEDAKNNISRRRKNIGFDDPLISVQVPKLEPQIINNADYQRFLKDTKYPSGTVFVDPQGIRRVKP